MLFSQQFLLVVLATCYSVGGHAAVLQAHLTLCSWLELACEANVRNLPRAKMIIFFHMQCGGRSLSFLLQVWMLASTQHVVMQAVYPHVLTTD
jgi:hypothetical protein